MTVNVSSCHPGCVGGNVGAFSPPNPLMRLERSGKLNSGAVGGERLFESYARGTIRRGSGNTGSSLFPLELAAGNGDRFSESEEHALSPCGTTLAATINPPSLAHG